MSTETPHAEHEEIEQLIAWYASGRLAPAERRRVADHLDGCDDCRQQLSTLEVLRGEVKAAGDREPKPSRDLFALTMARIESDVPRRPQARSWLAWWHATPDAARWALAAQLLLLIGLATAWLLPGGGGRMVTAGADGRGVGIESGAGARLQVGFSPTAPESAIRETLVGIEAEIVAGPSALGLYTVELPPRNDDGAAIEEALARLRALPGIVEYAEPLDRTDPPPPDVR